MLKMKDSSERMEIFDENKIVANKLILKNTKKEIN